MDVFTVGVTHEDRWLREFHYILLDWYYLWAAASEVFSQNQIYVKSQPRLFGPG